MTLTERKDFYPQLLLRNYAVLAFLAGLVAVRSLYPGLLALALIILLGVVQKKKAVHALFFCLCFSAALIYGKARSPVPPDEPLWLVLAMGNDDTHERPQTLYVEGKVAEADVYADGRVRLILNEVAPVPPPPSLTSLKELYSRLPRELVAALDKAEPYEGKVAVTLWEAGTVPLPGQSVAFSGRFARVRGFANTGVFTIDTYWHDRDVWARGWNVRGKFAAEVAVRGEPYFFAEIRNALWQDFVLALPALSGREPEQERIFQPARLSALQGTGQAFLPALIFGDRSGITPYQKDLLSKATLTHSIALSGLHLAYVGLIGVGLAFGLGRIWPGIVLRVPRPKLCFLTTVPLALLYLWIGGAPLSLMRSALMLFFFGLILFGHKAKVLMDGLFTAVFLIALAWPWALFDLSLQLSALSVGVIALFYPLVTGLARRLIPATPAQSLDRCVRDRTRAGLSLLFMSFCIQIVLGPLLVKTFGAVGLWFPLNLVWLPVLGAVVMPLVFLGFFCVCCGWTALAQLFLHAASLPCEGLMLVLQWMDEAGYLVAPLVLRPHWLAVAGLWLFLGLLPPAVWYGWRFWRQKREGGKTCGWTRYFWGCLGGCLGGALLATGMTAQAYYRYAQQDVSLAMLDVGQGQALVVSWPGGRALVDGGGFPHATFDVGRMVVAPYLTAEKPAAVDWLINSHPDYDHLGGMLYIFEGFSVTRGFAHNGDSIHNTLWGDFQRIASNKSLVPRYVWRAGDYIPLWDEPGNELGLEVLWPPSEGPRLEHAARGKAKRPWLKKLEERKALEGVKALERLKGFDGLKGLGGLKEARAGEGITAEATKAGASAQKPEGAEGGVLRGGKRAAMGNDGSLVLRLVWRDKGLALLCGDIGKKSLLRLLETTPAEALRSEILVLPHHGSKSSYVKAFYEAVDPEEVLVSCAYKNSWGFPNKTIVETLQTMGKPLYSTAEHGMVKIVWPREHQRYVETARSPVP